MGGTAIRSAGVALCLCSFLLSACNSNNNSNAISSSDEQPRGHDSARIIGGTEARLQDAVTRSTVALRGKSAGRNCSGTLIAKDLVLTAAHCVSGDSRIVFGTDSTQADAPSVDILSHEAHEDYDRERRKNVFDIALVYFKSDLPPGYGPVKLARESEEPEDHSTVMVAGYGVVNAQTREGGGMLRYADVKVKDSQYARTEMLLAQDEGSGVCFGDSGGPAYLNTRSGLLLFGVANRVSQEDCGGESVFARVSAHMAWMKSASKRLRKT